MAREQSYWEVIVGNIGRVYAGSSSTEAKRKYASYVKAAKAKYGRASGESVSLWKDGDVVKEHEPSSYPYTSNPAKGKKIPVRWVRFNKDGSVSYSK